MCLFSSPKQPSLPPPTPPPPPQPVPVPTEVAPQMSADQRRRTVEKLKKGLASTIKTTPQGLVGKGPELTQTAAEAMFPSMKKTLGT